jgi:prolipoprotein diacylglyceryltransferase
MKDPLWYDFRVIIKPVLLGTLTPYSILISACAALGLFLSWLLAGRDRERFIDSGIILALVILIGSRLSFVVRDFSYFRENPSEIPQFWLGGLTWPGAVLGAAFGVTLVHLIWKEPWGELIDSYLAFFGLLAVGIWLAGWGSQVGYGPPTESWFGIPVKDFFGVVKERWPLPILGAVISAGWTAVVIFFPLKRNRNPGFRGMLGITGLILINGIVSFFRVDPAPYLWGIRVESWISILLLAAGLGYLQLIRSKDMNEVSDS